MKITMAAFVLVGIALISHANADDSQMLACKSIADSTLRLKCFDETTKTTRPPAQGNKLNMIDILTDVKELRGKPVQTEGMLLMMGQMAILYAERGSTTALFVNIDGLTRDERRSLLAGCNGGCNVEIAGKVGEVMMNPGIIATSAALK